MEAQKLQQLKNLPSNTKKIIALAGKAGAGKDTIGDFLNIKYSYEKFSFAHPIRQIAKIAMNLNDDQVYNRDLYNEPVEGFPNITLRRTLQVIGTEMFRDMIDRDIWCKNLISRVKNSDSNLIYISDVRFPNELEYIKNNFNENCLFLKVTRDGYDGNVGSKGHESEAYDIPCDLTITNNGTLEDLYSKVADLITTINFDA
jgi:hypothetical protein